MQKKFFTTLALAAMAFAFVSVAPVSAATNSESSPWNNNTMTDELGFSCTTNPTLENLGTSFDTYVYMTDATTTSVDVAVIPAMQSGNCNYVLPQGDFTLDYIEVKLFEDYSALDSEVLETYELNPDNGMKLTITGLEEGEDYYLRYKPKFLNTETDEYHSNGADTATIHTLFPMKKKFYNIDMESDGTVTMSMKTTNPAYDNRSSAKVRMLLLTSKDKKKNVGAPVVKYLSSEASFLYYRFADVFAPTTKKEKKNFLVYKVSPKKFLTILKDGELHASTDLEELNPKKWNVYTFFVNRKGKVKEFSSNKKLDASASCGITTCKLN